jgi:small nuclear ribonucleoprotein (snRNP)-like protein
MRIPTKQIAIIVVVVSSFLLSPVTLMAQTGANDWSRLSAASAGAKLSVKLKDGKKVDGTLTSVSDTSLTLTVKNAAKEIRREDIATVHEVSKKSAGKATLIGLGIGAGVGAAIGLAGDASNDAGGFEKIDNSIAGAVTVIGAAAGALTGFALGKTGKKRVLLYESK